MYCIITLLRKWHTALLPLVLLVAANAYGSSETIQMVRGQQRLLQHPGVTRIAIANPNVADVKVVSAGQILVTATGDGRTELTVWRNSRIIKYQVTVSTQDPKMLKREIERILGYRKSTKIRIVNHQVHISGVVQSLKMLEAAETLAQRYAQVENMLTLDPSTHVQTAQTINQKLRKLNLKGARATVVGKSIFLEGRVDNNADLQKAEFVVQGMGHNIRNVLSVGGSRMIELDVEFVEVSKNSLDRIGILWPTDISGNVSLSYARADVIRGAAANTQGAESSLSLNGSISASFGLALQFNDGVSRVLARPRLIAGNNEEASFLAGGEIPMPIVTQNQMSVEFREYGIRLKATPQANGDGSIQAKLLTEVSQLDESVSVQGIPGFLVRRVNTKVTVQDGDTIVLSGLIHINDAKTVVKVPILGHIPILGELFKSRQFLEKRTELVIFVTLRVVEPASANLRKLILDTQKRFHEAEEDVAYSIFD
jgi:pilus assembly protein CpaC